MRGALICLLLVAASAGAQELPPVGTYQSGELLANKGWPDPATLTPSDRLRMEVLLRSAHAQKEQDAANERYRNMSEAERRAYNEDFRRSLIEVKRP